MYINGKKFSPKRFSSGELKLLSQDLETSEKRVDILYDGEDISIFELLIIVKYYKSNGYDVYLTLNYLPYQRMNHNNGYEVETLKYVSELFNDLKLFTDLMLPIFSTKLGLLKFKKFFDNDLLNVNFF